MVLRPLSLAINKKSKTQKTNTKNLNPNPTIQMDLKKQKRLQ